jgi:hypothetical protein
MATDREVHAVAKWLSGELKDGSREELEARRTLARILRAERMDMALRLMLANLIDPDNRDTHRQWLVFRRARGRAPRFDLRLIALTVWEKHIVAKHSWESAVKDAMNEHGASRTTVAAAWRQWEPFFRDPRWSRTFTRR